MIPFQDRICILMPCISLCVYMQQQSVVLGLKNIKILRGQNDCVRIRNKCAVCAFLNGFCDELTENTDGRTGPVINLCWDFFCCFLACVLCLCSVFVSQWGFEKFHFFSWFMSYDCCWEMLTELMAYIRRYGICNEFSDTKRREHS